MSLRNEGLRVRKVRWYNAQQGKVMSGMHSKESAQKIIIEACKNKAEVSMFNDKAKTAVDKAKGYHNSKKIRELKVS